MRKELLLATVAAGSCLLTSCVDNNYDLSDVDYSTGTKIDLTLPACSTGDILLKNIMELEDDGVVQVVDGVYCVKQTGKANIDPIHISEIKIAKPSLNPFSTVIKGNELLGSQRKAPRRSQTITFTYNGIPISVEIPNKEYIYNIQSTDANYKINDSKATGISTDVVNIERVGINQLKVTIRIDVLGLPKYLTTLHSDNLSLSLPKAFHVAACTFQGQAAKEIKNGKITLTDAAETMSSNSFDITKGIEVVLTLDEIEKDGTNFLFDAAAHTATFKGLFSLEGVIRLDTDDFNITELEKDKDKLIAFYQNGNDYSVLVPDEITIKGQSSFNSDIQITHFTGDAKHEVDNIDPIKLDDLPDFLNDPEVVLDLDNPLIFITAKSALSNAAKTKLTLTSNYQDAASVSRQTGELTIKGNNQTTSYYLAGKKASALPAEHKTAEYHEVTDLKALIMRIPHQIDVAVSPVTLHCENMDITKSYDVSVDYDVFAPLTFGENFKLVYQDSERGWIEDGSFDDLDDISDKDVEIALEAEVASNLPAEVSLSLIPLDENGNRLETLEVSEIRVPANQTKAPVTFSIKAANNGSILDILTGRNGKKQLDGVTYRAVIDNPSGDKTLKDDACIKLSNAKITVKGYVIYND